MHVYHIPYSSTSRHIKCVSSQIFGQRAVLAQSCLHCIYHIPLYHIPSYSISHLSTYTSTDFQATCYRCANSSQYDIPCHCISHFVCWLKYLQIFGWHAAIARTRFDIMSHVVVYYLKYTRVRFSGDALVARIRLNITSHVTVYHITCVNIYTYRISCDTLLLRELAFMLYPRSHIPARYATSNTSTRRFWGNAPPLHELASIGLLKIIGLFCRILSLL